MLPTCFVVYKEELLGLALLYSEKVYRFPEDLTELDVLHDGELAGDPSLVWALGTVNDDLFGRGDVGSQ